MIVNRTLREPQDGFLLPRGCAFVASDVPCADQLVIAPSPEPGARQATPKLNSVNNMATL